VKRPQALAITAAIAAVLLFASRKARAASQDPGADYFDPVYDEPAFEFPNAGDESPFGVFDWLDNPINYYAGNPGLSQADASNIEAFLMMIRNAEHYPVDVMTGMDFQTFYGGAKFYDMSDHPVITGELRGVALSPAMCKRAGFASGVCVSTAAGALQFTRPTWQRLRSRGAYLPDFSPESQLEAGRRLLAELGVPAKLRARDLRGAIASASKVWASLPGSTAGQGGKSFAFVESAFRNAGGVA
jgi:muramidase (phage lysozyme)